MNFENLEVNHKAFGTGVVTAKQGKYMTVKFATFEKVFVYPDIFEKFLTLSDGTVSDEIKEDICGAKLHKQAILNKKHEENMRAMTHGIVIPGKEFSATDSDDEEARFKNSELEEI